ncbi:Glycine betaine transporter BetL [Streptomonospora litoralis]|uniref:Glycine betaine transporter BetL n=1 Tax=Streptomonospora litoralis TaxID=2498135 RepID=A0A4P6Q8K8_9ACTN|nr:BCCT family transporter [Streptomonospora litoralis]QBI55569.1 Glycine betaine transporter BetL [Streptomonospora litoralis]
MFLILGALFTGGLATVADTMLTWITTYFGWFYIIAATFFLVFVLWLMFSRFGNIRLGPDSSRPEFGTTAWFAMLFTAGMGIGLVFYGVSEPAGYNASGGPNPEEIAANTSESAYMAMNYTLFHWGVHPWAIYIVLGLALGYFCFRKGLPMRPASALYPLIGNRIYGWVGNLVDILAVFGTLFGLATSLGLGSQQVNAGLTSLFGVPNVWWMQALIVAAITSVAVLSVMLGIDKGIRRLSVINLWLAAALMLAVFLFGPRLYILTGMADFLGYYVQHLPETSLYVANPQTDPNGYEFQQAWTLFYWGWWIAWSPFVGMFIARISYGRTIRQFITGTLFAPVGASVVWFSVFGGTALYYDNVRNANISEVSADLALYELLDQLPMPGILATLLSVLTIVVVVLFFATSSDSGSLVIDMLTNGGDPHPIKLQRFFWAVTEGLVTIVLVAAGAGMATGDADPLTALRSASLITGLPFAIVLIVICFGILKALRSEDVRVTVPGTTPPARGGGESKVNVGPPGDMDKPTAKSGSSAGSTSTGSGSSPDSSESGA